MHRHKAGSLNTEFKNELGNIAYHVACHLRVQNIGLKTRDVLKLVPNTQVDTIERCSGHDGTYAVKKEFFDVASKICKPVVNRVKKAEADYYSSDCPMAGEFIANGMADGSAARHPMSLLKYAYGI
jgi:Fe-S oxidoreductase